LLLVVVKEGRNAPGWREINKNLSTSGWFEHRFSNYYFACLRQRRWRGNTCRFFL